MKKDKLTIEQQRHNELQEFKRRIETQRQLLDANAHDIREKGLLITQVEGQLREARAAFVEKSEHLQRVIQRNKHMEGTYQRQGAEIRMLRSLILELFEAAGG